VYRDKKVVGVFVRFRAPLHFIMDSKDITRNIPMVGITVVWQSAKCIHSGNCVHNNPEVFQPRKALDKN
jgi:hypothetical protein